MKERIRLLFCGPLIGFGILLATSVSVYAVDAEGLVNVDAETDTEIGPELVTEAEGEPVIIAELEGEPVNVAELEEEPIIVVEPEIELQLETEEEPVIVAEPEIELQLETEALYLQEGENSVEAGWYAFVPETSDFYTFSNMLYYEGDDRDVYVFYDELPEYNFDYTWGYYLKEGETYNIYYDNTCDTTVSRIPYLKRTSEGIDYFVYRNKAIVIGYCGPDTLVWPETIDGLTTIVGATDFDRFFKRNHEITITFPAGMIGTTFPISYEWNKWTSDNPAVVSLKKINEWFDGQLTLKKSGTANISLVAEDAEDPPEYYLYHITIMRGEEKESEESGSGQSSSGQGSSNHGNSQAAGQKGNSGSGSTQPGTCESASSSETDSSSSENDSSSSETDSSSSEVDSSSSEVDTSSSDTDASLSEYGASETDTSQDGESSERKNASGMSIGVITRIGGISVLALLLLVIGLYIYNKKRRR